MDEIYYEKNKDKILDLSNLLADLVGFLKSQEMTEVVNTLKKMEPIAKLLGGIIESNFENLKADIDNCKEPDEIMNRCVDLKNQLWPL